MANTNEIKQKIVLEGEKQYSAALKDAQRNLKTLKSELKAETAELGKNATEQQKAATKAQSLKKQIAEQEKVVKTYRAALQEVKEKYADNEDAIAKWEQKLNDARTTLANMQSDLESVSGSLDGVGSGMKNISTDAAAATVATKSVADALSAIGSAGESVSSAIESIFSGMISAVENAITALWDMISETAARANNWTDLGSYYGSSAEEMQKWDHAVTSAGGSFENLIALTNQLAFGGKEKKITEIFGISKENYRNDLEYTRAVVAEMAKQKEAMQAAGTWDEAMSEVFGAKKAQNASWFISNWERVIQEAKDFNPEEGGYGMTGEELSNMNELYIKTKEIETRWISIKDKVAAAFAPRVMELQTNILGGLDALKDFLNAETPEEREEALTKLRENVEEFFRKVGEILKEGIEILNSVGHELQESDDPLTRLIGDILVKLTEALEWMINNQDAVKAAFEAIFGVWLIGKLAAVAGKLSGILMQIEAIKAFKGVNLTGGTPTTTPTTTPTGGTGGTGGGWLASKWAAIKGFFSSNGLSVLTPAAVIAAAVTPAVIAQKQNEETWKTEQAEREAAAAAAEEVLGETQDTQFIKAAAAATGPKKKADGSYDTDATGFFLNMNPTDDTRSLLMGLSARQNQQRAELANALLTYADPTAGNDTWGLLQRYWAGEALDPYVEDELLEHVTDALAKSVTAKAEAKARKEAEAAAFEEAEEVDLGYGSYTEQDRYNAVQDWWDAWRNAVNGDDTWEEEQSAFEYLQEVFGDDFADTFYNISERLNELSESDGYPEDLPADWWMDADSWKTGGSANENGVTSKDVESLASALGNVSGDARAGVREGIAGLKVTMDGQTVGRIVAPYVSQYIARDIE